MRNFEDIKGEILAVVIAADAEDLMFDIDSTNDWGELGNVLTKHLPSPSDDEVNQEWVDKVKNLFVGKSK